MCACHYLSPPLRQLQQCYTACPIQNLDVEWKIFHGCFLSFHLKCSKDVDYCCISNSHLQLEIEKLCKSARDSVYNANNDEISIKTNVDGVHDKALYVDTKQEKEVVKLQIPEPQPRKLDDISPKVSLP